MSDPRRDTAAQILAERRRHLTLGYDWRHDDLHWPGDLLYAALAYMCVPGEQVWPFEPETFKPSPDPIENLVRAGSLVAAEGDRLLRAAMNGKPMVSGLMVLGSEADHMVQMVEGLQQVPQELQSLKDSDHSA